jgi:hypothetical protein
MGSNSCLGRQATSSGRKQTCIQTICKMKIRAVIGHMLKAQGSFQNTGSPALLEPRSRAVVQSESSLTLLMPVASLFLSGTFLHSSSLMFYFILTPVTSSIPQPPRFLLPLSSASLACHLRPPGTPSPGFLSLSLFPLKLAMSL